MTIFALGLGLKTKSMYGIENRCFTAVILKFNFVAFVTGFDSSDLNVDRSQDF